MENLRVLITTLLNEKRIHDDGKKCSQILLN